MRDRNWLSALSAVNPRAAYVIAALRQGRCLPQSYIAQATFESGAAGEQQTAAFAQPVAEDFLVEDVESQVRLGPTFGQGSLFQGLALVTYAMNPGIDARLIVPGGLTLPLVVNAQYQPLEQLIRNVNSSRNGGDWPMGWVLQWAQTFSLDLVLNRALTQTQIPMSVSVTVKGLSLGTRAYDGIEKDVAIQWLVKAGLLAEANVPAAMAAE